MFLYFRLYNCKKLSHLQLLERKKKIKEIVDEERIWRFLNCHTFAPFPPSIKYLKTDEELEKIYAAYREDIQKSKRNIRTISKRQGLTLSFFS